MKVFSSTNRYPDYEFLSDNDVSKAAGLGHRYTDESLHGVISDIEILSDTDFLVCTFSSQVCFYCITSVCFNILQVKEVTYF